VKGMNEVAGWMVAINHTDVEITNEGGIGLFVISGITRKGLNWLRKHVPSQSDGVAYCDDRRMAWDIYQAMLADGLRVK